MSKRIGIVDLCTSHPQNWVPILRDLGYEVVACWDSGETRPKGFAKEFAKEHNIPNAVDEPEQMLGQIDAAIIHSANWERHVERAKPFVEADVPVLLDKPIVGNMKDANQLLDWSKQGKKIAGGSSLRFAKEVGEYLAEPVDERGETHTAFAGCGTDEFNYGIHAYSLLSGLMGPGIRSVRYLGQSLQKHVQVNWTDGRIGYLCIGKGTWLPFHITAVTDKNIRQISVDAAHIYRSLLEAVMPYLAGEAEEAPIPVEQLLEPEFAALAVRQSWLRNGAEVFLTDLRHDDAGYDGKQFAVEYLRARLNAG